MQCNAVEKKGELKAAIVTERVCGPAVKNGHVDLNAKVHHAISENTYTDKHSLYQLIRELFKADTYSISEVSIPITVPLYSYFVTQNKHFAAS